MIETERAVIANQQSGGCESLFPDVSGERTTELLSEPAFTAMRDLHAMRKVVNDYSKPNNTDPALRQKINQLYNPAMQAFRQLLELEGFNPREIQAAHLVSQGILNSPRK